MIILTDAREQIYMSNIIQYFIQYIWVIQVLEKKSSLHLTPSLQLPPAITVVSFKEAVQKIQLCDR